MHRRTFLRNLAVTPAAAANLVGGISSFSVIRNALAARGKTLVVIFQRGGCDGLNTVVPYRDDEYYNLRPDISIAPPGIGTNSALDLDGFFGFHPSLLPFQKIYHQGDMAILPTVHYTNGNRSHFSSQDFIESGSTSTRLSDGWINRYFLNKNQNGQLMATSFNELHHSLRGKAHVKVLPNLAELQKTKADSNFTQQLRSIFQQSIASTSTNRKLLHEAGDSMLDTIESLTSNDFIHYSPTNGAIYPESDFGKKLLQTAYLIKAGLGLEVMSINHNGWDDHVNQGGATGAHSNRLSDFSSGIAALYNDLGPSRMNDVVILTMTEFGRTAKQNANGGTDHGNASSWFLIGGGLNGGIYGDWPGLQQEDLYLNRYLKHTTDYRDILSEVITNHLGNNNVSMVLPGHNYHPVGFL